MRKLIITFLILFFTSSLLAEIDTERVYPDFKYIVQKRREDAQIKALLYSRWMDYLGEETREMDNYDVKYYLIDISLNFDNEYIEADNLIRFEITENNTSNINLHFTDNLVVDDILKDNQTLNFTHTDGIINVELGGIHNIGDEVELEILYHGYPQPRLEDGIKFEEHNGIPIVFSMVSPKGARKWWPCKDTPADKPDSLDIWVTFPEEYICASNGTLVEEIINTNNTKTSKWNEAYPVATYLTSFAITNYEMYTFLWEYEGNQMMVDNYVYPEQYNVSVELYGLCEEMLDFYSSIYGLYPFVTEKYGHATCTNLGAWAMEHQTCTSFNAGYISDPASEYVVAHELAHHWAGDCLTIGSWSHVWLKEGFASYSEALWAEHLFGFQGLYDYMLNEDSGADLNECLYRDENGSASHIFDVVVYEKGSWTVHMLRGVLGDEIFFQLMLEYFQDPEFIYGNVITEDLKNKAETVSGEELDWFFDEWFYNYGRPNYNYATYTSEEEDSLKITLFSEGTQGDPFEMFIPYLLNEETDRLWVEDGFNYFTLFWEGAVDTLEFDPENWVLDYGYWEQIPQLEEVEQVRDASAVIVWETFFDPDIEGYNVYRKIEGEDYIQLNTTPIIETFFYDEEVEPEQEYFYKIAVVFESNGNFISKFSNEIMLIPVNFTFDEGILLVDGTNDYPAGSPFPTDELVDVFYDEILAGYYYTSWDVSDSGIPPLTEIAKYSSIIWHTDDILNTPFDDEPYNIKSYLLAGGNLLISSWKKLFELSDNFYQYYLHFDEPETALEPDFAGAFGELGFPDITVDTEKIPLPFWNDNLQYVNKFTSDGLAEVIYRYDSASNDPQWENMVCAQRFYGDFKVYVLGFPLYFIEQNSATQIMNLILQDFNEPVSANNYELSITNYELRNFPNPFNPETTIYFTTDHTKNTELFIYNIKGQKIKTLECGESLATTVDGVGYSISWDGKDDNNNDVSSGVYLYRLKTDGKVSISKKMLLLR
ncbi:MAG: T9SS type A sorting domain-containing protein [Armatimonadetes bacterium]|nr:T9SS type A sorting domain-containing protein [Armatimonadota bacterium]